MYIQTRSKQRYQADNFSYALICTSTDYDAWRVGEAPVTVAEVVKTLHTNASHARAIAQGLLQDVNDFVAAGKLDQIKGCMEWSCVTAKEVSVLIATQIGDKLIWYRNKHPSLVRNLATSFHNITRTRQRMSGLIIIEMSRCPLGSYLWHGAILAAARTVMLTLMDNFALHKVQFPSLCSSSFFTD